MYSDDFMGYNLRLDSADTQLPVERGLSASSCAVLRVLMNACLTWTACTNEVRTTYSYIHYACSMYVHMFVFKGAAQGLADLLNFKVDCPSKSDLPSFFWQHFKNNIKALCKNLSESEDDVCLKLHLILQKISDQSFRNSMFQLHLHVHVHHVILGKKHSIQRF